MDKCVLKGKLLLLTDNSSLYSKNSLLGHHILEVANPPTHFWLENIEHQVRFHITNFGWVLA